MMNSILEPDITSMYGGYKLSLQEKISNQIMSKKIFWRFDI